MGVSQAFQPALLLAIEHSGYACGRSYLFPAEVSPMWGVLMKVVIDGDDWAGWLGRGRLRQFFLGGLWFLLWWLWLLQWFVSRPELQIAVVSDVYGWVSRSNETWFLPLGLMEIFEGGGWSLTWWLGWRWTSFGSRSVLLWVSRSAWVSQLPGCYAAHVLCVDTYPAGLWWPKSALRLKSDGTGVCSCWNWVLWWTLRIGSISSGFVFEILEEHYPAAGGSRKWQWKALGFPGLLAYY